MSPAGQTERATQDRVIALFTDELEYKYLGDWTDRPNNSNIEVDLLTASLKKRGYNQAQINVAVQKLTAEANNHSRKMEGNNHAVYQLLRYGISAKTEAGKPTDTIHLIHWDDPEKNDFALVEEVTLRGTHERRPDLVLYINGIAVAVIELKKGSKEIGDGIRQLLSNQTPQFNDWFLPPYKSSLRVMILKVYATAPLAPKKRCF